VHFLVVFFTKKKVIFFVLQAKVKKIKKWKKGLFFHFPLRLGGRGGYYDAPCTLQGGVVWSFHSTEMNVLASVIYTVFIY
jgi:hypothetical protein